MVKLGVTKGWRSVKVRPGTPLKFKSGTPGPPSNFKSGTPRPLRSLKVRLPSLFFNEFIFFRIFHRFFTYLFLCLFKIRYKKISTVSNRHQKSTLKINKYKWQQKIYLKKMNRTPVNPNPTEVITFLDCHRWAILFKAYL